MVLQDADPEGIILLIATGCVLANADLRDALLEQARFLHADLTIANLAIALLAKRSSLMSFSAGANLDGADLTDASLINSYLSRVSFVKTTVTGCNLDHANVYGAAVWSAQREPEKTENPPDLSAERAAVNLEFIRARAVRVPSSTKPEA